jgi:hypothetical protein
MRASKGVQIPLVNSHLCATVSPEDADFMRQFEWHLVEVDGKHYAATFVPDSEGGEQMVMMHGMVLALHAATRG